MINTLFWHLAIFVTMLVIECRSTNTSDQCPNVKTSLGSIRKRRHLAFPEGTDVVLTISLVKAFMTHAPAGWNIALEIDVLYPLPDEKFTQAFWRRKLHHRQKRQFWERLQNAIDYHNLNGRACILRSICEAQNYLAPPGKSLVHDLLRAIFTMNAAYWKTRCGMPYYQTVNLINGREKLLETCSHFYNYSLRNLAPIHEEDFTNEIGEAYDELLDPHFCDQVNDCPFSLLHFVLALNKLKY